MPMLDPQGSNDCAILGERSPETLSDTGTLVDLADRIEMLCKHKDRRLRHLEQLELIAKEYSLEK